MTMPDDRDLADAALVAEFISSDTSRDELAARLVRATAELARAHDRLDAPHFTCGCANAVHLREHPTTGDRLILCARHLEDHEQGSGVNVHPIVGPINGGL